MAQAPLTALARALDEVAAVPLWQLSEVELGAAVEQLARVEARLQAAQVAVLGEAMARGVPGERGAKSAGGWLRQHVALTPAAAASRARLAQESGGQPELAPTRAGFRGG